MEILGQKVMKDIKDILEDLQTRLGYQKITELNLGISNKSYLLDDKYFLKTTFDDNFLLCSDNVLFKSAEKAGIGISILDTYSSTEFQLSIYQKNLKSIPIDQLDKSLLTKLVKGIKSFHNLKSDKLIYQDIDSLTKDFLEIEDNLYHEYVDIFPLPPDNVVPCHLDLVEGNILWDNGDEVKIIDYDLSILGYEYYDLVSLLSENKLNSDQRELIIKEYYNNDSSKIEWFFNLFPILEFKFNILWYTWARARQKNAPLERREAFRNIAESKKVQIDEFITNCIKDCI